MQINRRSINPRILLRNMLISFSITFLASEVALASEKFDFEVGSSCATIIFSEPEALEWLVESLSDEELDSFCYPEEPSICSDYSGQVESIGSIKKSQTQTEMCVLSAKE